ncbi:hypothetical protein L2K20_26120 [Mycobacterium sp. MBM]|nr:hypothetical protein [Mycobacterium sp. MBM]
MTGPTRPSKDVVNAIFGEDMPRITKDERDGDTPFGSSDREMWLRDNVPPHHG